MILKKAASIFLLLIFLFNTIGYKAFFLYQERQADARIEARIRTISELDKRLISIKIPINLPYQTDWREFESVDGEMSYKGRTYKYVKRKVMRDSIILLCIDHKEKSQIEKTSSDYFKKVNDLASDNQKKPVLKQAKSDYYQETKDLFNPITDFRSLHSAFSSYSPREATGYPQKAKMPPRGHMFC